MFSFMCTYVCMLAMAKSAAAVSTPISAGKPPRVVNVAMKEEDDVIILDVTEGPPRHRIRSTNNGHTPSLDEVILIHGDDSDSDTMSTSRKRQHTPGSSDSPTSKRPKLLSLKGTTNGLTRRPLTPSPRPLPPSPVSNHSLSTPKVTPTYSPHREPSPHTPTMGPLVHRPTHGREHNKKRPHHSKDHSQGHATSPLSSKGDKVRPATSPLSSKGNKIHSVRKLFPGTSPPELLSCSSNQKSPGNSGHMTQPLSKPCSILKSPELKLARPSSGTPRSPPSNTSTPTHRTPPSPSSNKPLHSPCNNQRSNSHAHTDKPRLLLVAKSQPPSQLSPQPPSTSLPHTDKSQPSLNSKHHNAKLHPTHNNNHLLTHSKKHKVTHGDTKHKHTHNSKPSHAHNSKPGHAHNSKPHHAHKVAHDSKPGHVHDSKPHHAHKVAHDSKPGHAHDSKPHHAHDSKHKHTHDSKPSHAHKVAHDAQLHRVHDTKSLHDHKVSRERAVSDPGQTLFVGKGKAPHGKSIKLKFPLRPKHKIKNWQGCDDTLAVGGLMKRDKLQSHPFTSKHNSSSASLTDTVIPPSPEPDSPMDTAAFQLSSTTSRSGQTPNDSPFIPHSSPPGCTVGLLCRLQPHFCRAPSCNLKTVQPFGKFVKGWLGNYADGLETNVGSVQNYLGLLQEMILHGSHIPSEEISVLLEHVLKLSEEDIMKVNYLLQQDLLLQEKIDISGETLWTIIEKCLETLEKSDSSAVSRLRSEVVLSYVFGLLFKDLNGKTGEPGDSLVEKILSLRQKWSNLTKLLHLLCSTIERESENDLLDLLMSMVSLPLLTCRQLDRRELATRLAREISNRLGGLSSTEKKRQLLLAIPSDYLRERVIRIHLKTNFVLHSSITQEDPESYHEDDVSLAHISQVHLNRVPYSRNGVLDLTYFLMLLCYLIQSHVRCLQGVPILTYLGDDVPTHWRNFPLMSEEELQVSLLSLSPQVLRLSERLTMDETLLIALTSGENWMYLQLLQSLTGL